MATTQSKYGRHFDEEFKREVAALASKPGATQEPVAHDLGVSAFSVARWKKRYGGTPAAAAQRQHGRGGAAYPHPGARERRPARAEDHPRKSSRHLLRTPALKMGVIRSLAGQHPVRKLCRVLGVSRSAYYAAPKKEQRSRARANGHLSTKARELFEVSGRTYGSPRLTVALRRAGERCGRHRVARLMRKAGLRARQKRRFRPRTTASRHLCPIAPNHLAARTEPPTRPGEVWQADITYVATREGWLCVAGVLDACSRKLVGWAAADTMPTALVARAFERAVQAQRPVAGLLHRSDRGSQYASDAYRKLLCPHGVIPSMSRAGNCYDNARMESFWATMKIELIDGQVAAGYRRGVAGHTDKINQRVHRRLRSHGGVFVFETLDQEQDGLCVHETILPNEYTG